MPLMTRNLSTFGSRFSVILDPYHRRIKHGVLGMFLERESELICGVEADGSPGSYLPFSDHDNQFDAVYASTTMNSITYHCINTQDGYDLICSFTSPFSPDDEQLMIAPFFYIDVSVKRRTRPHNLTGVKRNIGAGRLRFGLIGEGLQTISQGQAVDLQYDVHTSSRFVQGDFARTLQLSLMKDGEQVDRFTNEERLWCEHGPSEPSGIFDLPFNLDEQDEWTFHYIWTAYNSDDFITVKGVPHRLLYTSSFHSMDDIITYAQANRQLLMTKSQFYDETIEASSLSRSWKDFIGFTFQSYKLNTLYAVDASGSKSFTVWEGNCMYNATLDVEYNNGLFYYTMCPSLLPIQFEQWAATEAGEGYIDHDLGEAFHIERATYGHPMKIEENCNFILMLYAHCTTQGTYTVAEQHYETLKRLVDYMIAADTTGNGIPNIGTDNTIDDAVPAIQNAKEQTYLAIKTSCAFQCFAKLAAHAGDTDYENKANGQAQKIMKTVDAELWLQDHYGVCLDTTQDGYVAFLTNELLKGPMEGKDSYSIYAENGLLYPLLSGFMPDFLNESRLRHNIYNSYKACDSQYGSHHSNDSDSIWFSQNMWRDFTAAYLGHDLLDNVDKYWSFQKLMNTGGQSKLYIDTYGENALWHYPRGLTSIGVLYAMLRLQIDRAQKTIRIAPLRRTMRIPLPLFADWANSRMPWVVVDNDSINIENEDLLDGYEILITT